MKNFKDLFVWQKSHALTLYLYEIIDKFPKEELYGISSQLRRAIVSVPTNLAEGCGRGSDKDFKRFVQIALGSASETEYLLLLCKDLGYMSIENFNKCTNDIQEIKKMLTSLILKLKASG